MEVTESCEEATNTNASQFDISVVSKLVRPDQCLSRARLADPEILDAHWQVLLECNEVTYYLVEHENLYMQHHHDFDEKSRRINFHPYFLDWVCRRLIFRLSQYCTIYFLIYLH